MPMDERPKKKKKSGDRLSLIFFVILAIGLVVLTVIILTKPTSTIYSADYGDKLKVSIELYSNNNVDIAIDVDSNRVVQSGTYTELDDGIKNNYEVVFKSDDNTEEKGTIVIDEDKLTLTYDDGTIIECKETK